MLRTRTSQVVPYTLLLLLLASLASKVWGQSAAQTNLVADGDFEQGAAAWQFTTMGGANASGQLDTNQVHAGKYAYKLTDRSGFGPNVYARVFQVVRGLRPYTTYRVSCWAKGRGCGIAWIGGGPGWTTRHAFPKGDFDWRQESFELDAGPSPDSYELMALTESQTEALWVDDIRFEPVKVDQAKQQAIYTQLNTQAETLRGRLQALQAQAGVDPRLAASPYLRLGRAVASRFLDFAQKGGPDGRMGLAWARLQLEEVGQVLNQTEELAREHSATLLDWQPPKPGPVKLKHGTFYERGRPFYFAGYGHFAAVINDLPNFPALGASLIQDGSAGPSSMNPDGTMGPGALDVLKALDRADRYGMRVDFLLSPHYYPSWASAPDLANGNIGFLNYNIFHPKAKATLEQWVELMAKAIRDKPALHSVCLANEPVYISSGRDPYSRPAFTAYLKARHPSLAELNALYASNYKSFDEVPLPAPSMPAGVPAQRAYYDWSMFNKQMFAGWHAWLGSLLKRNGVRAPTHTKIMVFFSLDRDKLGWGVDPELMCHATDLAGCDAYAFMTGPATYDWAGQEFFYDLLHSFRGQSVFNSENHLIPDNAPPNHVPMAQSRSVLWQGGLHHQGSTTIWVWEQAADPSLAGSIYFRPANTYGAGRAMLDLQRLAPEVTALNNARPRVALLYSQPALFWDSKYAGTLRSLYNLLTFAGEPVTFVSERQLAEGTAAKVQWLILPEATHVLSSTPAALAAFAKHGRKLLLVGEDCLSRDEYDRPLSRPRCPMKTVADGSLDSIQALHEALAPLRLPELRDVSTGKSAWGIEFQVLKQGRTTLVPLDNFNGEVHNVCLPHWAGRRAIDLLSGQPVALDGIQLQPMVPRLLRIEGRR